MDQRSNIAIVGFGIEGKAIFEYLHKHEYANITVCDSNVDLKEDMPEGVSVRLGPHYLDDLSDFDVIFRSPGIRYLEPGIQAAKANGSEITSSTAYFMDQCPCPVVGITGTKGKGTTATLIHKMLQKSHKKSYLAGNIGDPAISILDNVDGDDIVVLELSSFQLQDMTKSPRYSVLLNTTTDHLDYHADRDEYLAAKESLLVHQHGDCLAVFNMDYEYVKYYEPLVKGEKRYISTSSSVSDGAFAEDGEIIFSSHGKRKKICDVSEMALIGSHNLENVLPAVVIARELGVKTEHIAWVIRTFEGLPHRLEFAGEVNGVKYYNDSFSTTPETSMAAVDSFDEPTVLIAGGHDKGLDYKEWALKILIKPNLHTVILVGDTAEQMASDLKEAEEKLGEAEGSPTTILRAGNLKEAVKKAYEAAEAGGVVVMSPASSSFDLYKDYKARGAKFMKLVKNL